MTAVLTAWGAALWVMLLVILFTREGRLQVGDETSWQQKALAALTSAEQWVASWPIYVTTGVVGVVVGFILGKLF